MTEQNRETIRRWVEDMWNKGERQLCAELMAIDFVEHAHAPFSDHEPGEVDGPETMRTSMDWLLGQFPDLTMSINALVAEGDMVALRVSSEGTNLGRLNGRLPPSGRRFKADQSHWFRLEHGKIAGHWATRDDLTSMLQLGVVSMPRLAALVRLLPAAVVHHLRGRGRK